MRKNNWRREWPWHEKMALPWVKIECEEEAKWHKGRARADGKYVNWLVKIYAKEGCYMIPNDIQILPERR